MKKLLLILLFSGLPIAAHAQYPATMVDNFSTGVQTCWNGSANATCLHYWGQRNGTGATIVATPACLNGQTGVGTSSLQVSVPAATTTNVKTSMNFPVVPHGTTMDLNVEFCVSSFGLTTGQTETFASLYDGSAANFPNGPLVLLWRNNGGTPQVGVTTNGNCTASAATFVNFTTAAAHLVHVHLATGASASSIQIDGGTASTYTYTDDATCNVTHIGIGSNLPGDVNNRAITYQVGFIKLGTLFDASAPPLPTALMDFGGATNGSGFTQANAETSIHGGGHQWDISASVAQLTYDNSFPLSFSGMVSILGTAYSGNSGLNQRFQTTNTLPQWVIQDWPHFDDASWPALSIGYFARWDIPNTDLDLYGLFLIEDDAVSDFCGWNINANGSLTLLTTAGSASYTPTSFQNHWFWFTNQYVQAGTCTGKVYDVTISGGKATALTLLQTLTVAQAAGGGVPVKVEVGSTATNAETTGLNFYQGNMLFQFGQQSFPVLPPIAATFGTIGKKGKIGTKGKIVFK